jgi:P4 family phage/plasmid primase-like protien
MRSPSKADKVLNLQKMNKFLEKHTVEKGENIKTHTTCGPPWKSYNISDSKMDQFLELYTNCVMDGTTLHFIERPRKVGPLLIDIDMDFDADCTERQYTREHIESIIEATNNILKKYYKLTKNTIKAFVFEKDKPTCEKKRCKDGFHIMYPHVGASEGMRFLITDELKNIIINNGSFDDLEYNNSMDDVFDTRVIKSNGWTMYRSRKHDGQFYKLTGVYTNDLEEDRLQKYKNRSLPRVLSNRKFSDDQETEFKDKVDHNELKKQIKKVVIKYDSKAKEKAKKKINTEYIDEELSYSDEKEKVKKEQIKNNGNKLSGMSDITMAKKLAKILSAKRAKDYDSWLHVGWALYNTSTKLLDAFKSFSKKCLDKYDAKGCEQVWNHARSGGFTIASLYMWAKQDDPEGYNKILRENVNALIEEAESGTEYDIAKVIYELYKFNFKCSSINHNIWFEFQKHRWVEIERGNTLGIKISEELTKEFAFLSAYYLGKCATATGKERDTCWSKAENIRKIMLNLKKTGFKKRVLEECAPLFFDKEFEEKLDSSRNLVGFINGVYDLDNECFRDGTPDDYVTFSVGYKYENYDLDHPHVKAVEEYFEKTMLEEDMREYVLTLLASYLDGYTKQQKFILWTGSGSNGKSLTCEFYQMAFGDYCGVLPTTVLTKKRGSSSAASPELAQMRGKRFVVIQEPESDDRIYVGFMKELTGGDWIYARPLFRDPIRFKPQFKLLLTCNKLPFIPSTDGGTWRRLRVSPWESEFVDVDEHGRYDGKELKPNQFPKDYDLGDKMEVWKGAFLWYLINVYYPLYKKQGIKEPKKVTLYTDKYRKASDIYLEFLDENIVITKNYSEKIPVTDIYTYFRHWYGESYAKSGCPSKKDLQEYMGNHNYKMKNGFLIGAKFNSADNTVAEGLDE